MLLIIIIYLLGCAMVAILGRKTLAGPVGFFMISLLATPILAYFFLLMSSRRLE